jgi:hypothetical protein
MKSEEINPSAFVEEVVETEVCDTEAVEEAIAE